MPIVRIMITRCVTLFMFQVINFVKKMMLNISDGGTIQMDAADPAENG